MSGKVLSAGRSNCAKRLLRDPASFLNGITVRFESELVSGLNRNHCPVSIGIRIQDLISLLLFFMNKAGYRAGRRMVRI